MSKKTLQQVIQQHKDFGFDQAVIEIAYSNVKGDSSKIMDQIFRLQQESSAYPTKPSNANDQETQLSKAIELSMNEAKDKKINLQPLNPEQRVRKSGVPVGLKNIGNTCYFNSLLQTYFQNIAFVKNILRYQIPKKYIGIKDEQIQKNLQTDHQYKKKLYSCRLVDHLKKLFGSLICSDKKYIDPTAVISSIVDDYGNELAIGDQKDIGQFNLIFLSRVEDGLQEQRREGKMEIEFQQKQNMNDSPSKINFLGKEDGQLSFLRSSSIRIHQKSIIGEQFIGKIQHTFINQKQNINKTQQELFSLLFVNIKNKQLYKACQEITISNIDDYRNDKGEVIGVEKQSWIKEAPKTLFFQIDRVIYNKESQTLQKINDSFDFPTVFYIDPFLLKNKEKALQIQKKVRELRQKKQKYISSLQSIQKYGQKHLNLIDMLGQTSQFLKMQESSMEYENQLDNSTYIAQLKDKISPNIINLLNSYKTGLSQRVQKYKENIDKIDKDIAKFYEEINSTPYYLYSLLIHQGGADSGHYYSYIFDYQNKKWRKYNDINITEQVQAQVIKQGKGINVTSAYYLVYAQNTVLEPSDNELPKQNYSLSTQQRYFKDYFSYYLSQELKNTIVTENHQMYNEIQQFKMSTFAARVIDVYAKKFQTFNEIFRKQKIQKKKNTPPLLTSLPIFVKNIDQNEYKNLIIQQAITEYGPKETSIIFQDQMKKKLGNFNEFKRPKKFNCNEKLLHAFINNYYWAIAARRLFQSIEKQQYNSIFTLLKELLKSDISEYFNWLARLLLKIFVVKFLHEAEKCAKINVGICVQRLQMAVVIMLKYVNLQEQKMLWLNSIFWINDILIAAEEQKDKIQALLSILDNKNYQNEYAQIQQRNENEFKDIVNSVDLNDALWNSSRQQNTVINSMLEHREKVKGKFEICNKLYVQMKKYNYPLKKEQRDTFLNP